jgi:hypothetical protein
MAPLQKSKQHRLLKRLIAGDEFRISRFHDEKGNFVGPRALVTFPVAVLYRVLSKLRIFPAYPWLGFSAIQHIRKLLRSDWRVLEFGSGMSTLWWARHSNLLVSREDNETWYNSVASRLQTKMERLQYILARGEQYYDLSAFPNAYFDFILVDGSYRSKCIEASLPKLKPGGYMYLDNSDKDIVSKGDLRRAEAVILEAVNERKGTARYFTDFAPGNLTPQQGLLVQLP